MRALHFQLCLFMQNLLTVCCAPKRQGSYRECMFLCLSRPEGQLQCWQHDRWPGQNNKVSNVPNSYKTLYESVIIGSEGEVTFVESKAAAGWREEPAPSSAAMRLAGR